MYTRLPASDCAYDAVAGVEEKPENIYLNRLLRRWKFATYALISILCFTLAMLLLLLQQQNEHAIEQIFCEPGSLNFDRVMNEANVLQHPQKLQLSSKRSSSTTTFMKTEHHIKDLQQMRWTDPGTISMTVFWILSLQFLTLTSHTDIGIVQIDKSDALRLPNHTLNIPGDKDHYIVGIEVFHQLHCLVTRHQNFV